MLHVCTHARQTCYVLMSLLSLMLLLPRSNPAVTLTRKVLSKLRTSTRNLHRLCLTCLCLRAPVAAQAFLKQQRKKKIAARATYCVFLLSHGSLFSLSLVTHPHIFNLNPHLHLFHDGTKSARSCTRLGTRRPANAHLCRSRMSRLATSGGR